MIILRLFFYKKIKKKLFFVYFNLLYINIKKYENKLFKY